MTIKSTFESGLRRSPLQVYQDRRARRRLVVLAYHSVTSPGSFGRQLDHLVAHRSPVVLEDVSAARRGTRALPEAPTLVTFDDADRSILDHAAPMMRSRGIEGVAFTVAGVVGSRAPFWWDEVLALRAAGGTTGVVRAGDGSGLVQALKGVADRERLAAMADLRNSAAEVPDLQRDQLLPGDLVKLEVSGIEIGNHTMTHPCLPRCDDHKVEREIRDAHEHLTDVLGHPPRAFAYPNGDPDPRAEPILRELGYEFAFLFDHRLASLERQDPLRLSRVRADPSASIDRFAILVSGLHPAIHRLRGRQ